MSTKYKLIQGYPGFEYLGMIAEKSGISSIKFTRGDENLE